MKTINDNKIKNVFVVSGDSHSSYIDDGANSLLPEISASNLDVNNSLLHKKLEEGGISIWNQGTYDENGHTYGKVSFIFGEEDYALLEVIDEKGKTVVSLPPACIIDLETSFNNKYFIGNSGVNLN